VGAEITLHRKFRKYNKTEACYSLHPGIRRQALLKKGGPVCIK